MKHLIYFFLLSLLTACTGVTKTERIPVIYGTDLYQPPEDPDDHYDLAILASLPELDVRAVVFDNATAWRDAAKEAGIGALNQVSELSGRPVPPYATGLRDKLISEKDKAENQSAEYQKGVQLIIRTLRDSKEKVILFMVGSCRDFAAAFNREPDLFHEKVRAVYISAGNGPDGWQFEWNVGLDQQAYVCLMKSGLPIYWAPCFSQVNLRQATPEEVVQGASSTFNSYYIVPNQARLLDRASAKVKNYFAYALNKRQDDPVRFLSEGTDSLPQKARNMWSTASFFHAAGRKIYQENGNYRAYNPRKAEELGVAGHEITVYSFDPVDVEVEVPASDSIVFRNSLDVIQSNVQVFRYTNPEYNDIMVSTLSGLLGEL